MIIASHPIRSVADRKLSDSGFWTRSWYELQADAPLHFGIGLYLLLACVLALLLDVPDRLLPLNYMTAWVTSVMQICVIVLATFAIPRVLRDRSFSGVNEVVASLARRWKHRLLPALALSVSMSIFFGTFTSIKNMLPLVVPYWCDKLLADLGLFLHGGHSPWFLLQPILGYPPVTRVFEFLYGPVWFLLLTGVPVFLSLTSRSDELHRRYLVATMLCFVLLGNVVAALGMSAGPIYYGAMTGDHDRYADVLTYLQSGSGALYSAWDVQQHLLACWRRGAVELGTGISAFPSLHVSMATLFVLATMRADRRLALTFGAYLFVIFLGSIHLGWHYAVDGYISFGATLAIWRLAGRITAPSSRERWLPIGPVSAHLPVPSAA